MSWVRIWVHLVFSTKNREPYLNNSKIRNNIFNHIKENSKKKNIWLEEINGYKDHIHCLVSLSREQSISKVAQLIKGESSNWINKNNLTKTKFYWQDDYWAVSISESHMKSVKDYIIKQELHHKSKPFAVEVDEFMRKYGWKFVENK
jgi:REP-associated tyrosine transposase